MGFVTPISVWFRGPLAEEAAAIARGSALAELGWFDAGAIARLNTDHRSGKSEHGRLLWQLLMLDKSLPRLSGLGTSSGYMSPAKQRPSGGAMNTSACSSPAPRAPSKPPAPP